MTGGRQQDGAAAASKRLTLTFDNGPTPGITERVLDILARHGLQATFFVIGRQLRDPAAAALLPRIEQAGHRIGNHTLNHKVALGDRPDAAFAQAEIEAAQALIGAHAGAEKLFRPYGNDGLLGPHLFSAAALSYLRHNGYTSVLWNLVPGDWRNPNGWDADGARRPGWHRLAGDRAARHRRRLSRPPARLPRSDRRSRIRRSSRNFRTASSLPETDGSSPLPDSMVADGIPI